MYVHIYTVYALTVCMHAVTPSYDSNISISSESLTSPPFPRRQESSPGFGSRHRGLSIRRRLSEAYGMVAPNVRRPSIRTDLLILRAKTSLHLTGIDAFTDKKPRREVSCVIQ